MSVSISYQLSGLGRKESLRQGGTGKLVQTIVVDRASPVYDRALALAEVDLDGKATLVVGQSRTLDGKQTYAIAVQSPAYDSPQTPEALVAEEECRRATTTETVRVKNEVAKKEQHERREQIVAGLLKQGLVPLKVSWDEGAIYFNGSCFAITRQLDDLASDPRVTDLREKAVTECNRLNELAKLAKAAAEAAEKAKKEVGVKILRTWADSNGSDLLKARIADGFEWVGLAEREYANSVVSDMGEEVDAPEYESVKASERTTPTLEEIHRLREIRKGIEGKPATADLKWLEYTLAAEDEYGTTGETEKVKQAEVEVTVECPTGREVEFYYACPAVAEK